MPTTDATTLAGQGRAGRAGGLWRRLLLALALTAAVLAMHTVPAQAGTCASVGAATTNVMPSSMPAAMPGPMLAATGADVPGLRTDLAAVVPPATPPRAVSPPPARSGTPGPPALGGHPMVSDLDPAPAADLVAGLSGGGKPAPAPMASHSSCQGLPLGAYRLSVPGPTPLVAVTLARTATLAAHQTVPTAGGMPQPDLPVLLSVSRT